MGVRHAMEHHHTALDCRLQEVDRNLAVIGDLGDDLRTQQKILKFCCAILLLRLADKRLAEGLDCAAA